MFKDLLAPATVLQQSIEVQRCQNKQAGAIYNAVVGRDLAAAQAQRAGEERAVSVNATAPYRSLCTYLYVVSDTNLIV